MSPIKANSLNGIQTLIQKYRINDSQDRIQLLPILQMEFRIVSSLFSVVICFYGFFHRHSLACTAQAKTKSIWKRFAYYNDTFAQMTFL
jgi:hypothetical protein